MDTLECIANRRSVRQFQDTPIPRYLVEQVLHAAVQAPSGGNRQPWRFVVVEGKQRRNMVNVFRKAIGELKVEGADTGSAEWSANAMEQAGATIFVFNRFWPADAPRDMWNLIDTQSLGAAVQNMLLAADHLGLGSLWVCDIYYAREELSTWLNASDGLVAAVALGYSAEQPEPRNRISWTELTHWIGDR